MTRKYTGFDGNSTGKRAGTEKFAQLLITHFNGAVWSNGSWVVRSIRGGDQPSVHGTGRAIDLSWRRRNDGKGFGNYKAACAVLDFCVQHSELLLIEDAHDYHLAPYGRGWRCDRNAWKVYDKPTIGSPGGDWWHIEIAPTHADDPSYYVEAFKQINSGVVVPVAQPAVSPLVFTYPGKALRVGSKGDAVKLVQALLGIKADGNYGAQTKKAVIDWQTANPKCGPADGVVGQQTWSMLFGS